MRWAWAYTAGLFSTWPIRAVGALFTIVPLALAVFDSNLRFLWLFLLAAFLNVVQAWHANRTERSAPRLSLGEPIVGPRQPINAPTGTGWNEMRGLGSGIVVRVPVFNEQGAEDAEGVYTTLRFTGDGFDLVEPARWRDAPNSREITIAGNGRANEVDLFVHFPGDKNERAYVWNQESLVAGVKHDDYRISPDQFSVEVMVRGSHPQAIATRAWRVWARVYPEIVPDGEMFASEIAYENAKREEEVAMDS